MKKIFFGIIAIPVVILLIYLISYTTKIAFFLLTIDNTEFGFPMWLDIVVDIVAGVITYIFMLSLYGLSNKDRKTIEQVVSIIIGAAVSFGTHCFLRYWYLILGILAIMIIVAIILFVKNKKGRREL